VQIPFGKLRAASPVGRDDKALEIGLQEFQVRINDFGAVIIGNPGGLPFHILHQAVEVVAGTGDADDAEAGLIPERCGLEFGNRDVEAGSEAVFEAADYLPPVFQGLRRFDAEFEGEEGDQGFRGLLSKGRTERSKPLFRPCGLEVFARLPTAHAVGFIL
jgi:hypothetical protein